MLSMAATSSTGSRNHSPNRTYYDGSDNEGEHQSFLLPSSEDLPIRWIDQPFTLCGSTPSVHVSKGNVLALMVINLVAGFAFTALGIALKQAIENNGLDSLAFTFVMLISTATQSALEFNSIVFRKMKVKIDVGLRVESIPSQSDGELTLDVVVNAKQGESESAESSQSPLAMNGVEEGVCTVARFFERVEPIFNWESRFGTELFLCVANAEFNVSSIQGQEALLTVNLLLAVGLLVRDGFNLGKIRSGHYVSTSRSLNVNEPVNQRLSPRTDDLLPKLAVYGTQAGIGCLLIGLGGGYDFAVRGLGELSFGLGTILVSEGIGYFLAEGLRRSQRQCTMRYHQQLDFSSGSPRIPVTLSILRRIIKVLHNLSTEASCVVVGFVPKEAFFPVLGIFMGLMSHRASTSFEHRASEDLKKIRSESFENPTAENPRKKLAVRVNQVTTGLFFTLYTAFFIYGLVASDDKERAGIAVLLGSTAFFGVFSRWLQHRFKPGENGRLFNESVYQLLFNRYAVVPYYYAFTAIGGAEGAALNGDSGVAYGANLVAQALFGMIIGANQTADFREVTFAPPIFRAQAINLIILILRGDIPVYAAPLTRSLRPIFNVLRGIHPTQS